MRHVKAIVEFVRAAVGYLDELEEAARLEGYEEGWAHAAMAEKDVEWL